MNMQGGHDNEVPSRVIRTAADLVRINNSDESCLRQMDAPSGTTPGASGHIVNHSHWKAEQTLAVNSLAFFDLNCVLWVEPFDSNLILILSTKPIFRTPVWVLHVRGRFCGYALKPSDAVSTSI